MCTLPAHLQLTMYIFFNAAGAETANMVPTLNTPCCYHLYNSDVIHFQSSMLLSPVFFTCDQQTIKFIP